MEYAAKLQELELRFLENPTPENMKAMRKEAIKLIRNLRDDVRQCNNGNGNGNCACSLDVGERKEVEWGA